MTISSTLRRSVGLVAGLALALLALAPATSRADIKINPQVMQLFSCSQPTIAGTAGNDALTGTAAADKIRLYAGNDSAMGLAGNDRICGEEGNDYLTGYAGNDMIRGGAHDDHIVGDGGDDLLFGDGGNDIVVDAADKDSAYGGAGNDTLWSSDHPGGDYVHGGDGFDTCYVLPEDVVVSCENVISPQQPPA